ncbi:hypothetical protein V502_05914 [Pseudogymnoascus sp. VKM F-4520 (FW-2644)]|nr:hypothetical protein V502_05914 [Pseudogymnoascus sp. VKM F-4520 (FW-2644)]
MEVHAPEASRSMTARSRTVPAHDFNHGEAAEYDSDEMSAYDPGDAPGYDSDEASACSPNEGPEHDSNEALFHLDVMEDEDKIPRLLDEDEDEYQDMIRDINEDIILGPNDESSGDTDVNSNEELDVVDIELGAVDKTFPGAPVQIPDVEAVAQRFWTRFCDTLQELEAFARGIKYNKTREKPTYPSSFSFWSILRNVSKFNTILDLLLVHSPSG